MRTYETARGTGQVVAFIGWAVVAGGALLLILAFGTMSSGFGALGLVPAFGVMVGGLLLVCQGQLIQALADTAMNTGVLVELMRGDRSRAHSAPAAASSVRVLAEQRPRSASPSPPLPSHEEREAIAAARADLDPDAQYNRYFNHTIVRYSDGTKVSYRTAGSVFGNLEEAADFLDMVRPEAEREQ